MTATPARGNGWPSESILSPLYICRRAEREVLPRQDTRLLNNLLIMCGFLPARTGTHATTIVYIDRGSTPKRAVNTLALSRTEVG